MKTIEILVGLPGAGKSFYASTTSSYVVSCDNFTSLATLCEYTNSLPYNSIILDGLFLSELTQRFLFSSLVGTISFTYFTPNRTQSLYNDSLRNRNLRSHITILNAPICDPLTWIPLTISYHQKDTYAVY